MIKARERGVLCNSFSWDEADAKVRSYLFLCLGAEGQRQIQQKRPKMQLHTVSTQQLMTVLEDIFVTTRIIAFERYNFICRKQKKTESLEQFHADLVELASRADCGGRESELVRDMFTAHMNNEKIAEKLLAQTRTPQEAYEYAIRREKGIEHSRTMKVNLIGGQAATTPKQEPIHYVYTIGRENQQYNLNNQRGRGSFRGRPYPRGSQNTRGQQYQQQRNTNYKQCFKCGNQYGPNHLQSCPAKDKICSKCAKRGHFAKVFRSTNFNYLGNTNEEQQQETKIESTGTDTDPVAYAEFTTNNGWENYQMDDFSVIAILESFEIKDTKTISEDDLNGHIVKLRTNTTELFAIADSGSPMTFLNEKTAQRLQQNNTSAIFKNIPPEDTARNLACYNGEYIQPKGRLIPTIESWGWKVQTAPFIIVDNQKANILGRNLLPRIGIKLIQDKPTQKVLNVRSGESNLEIN